MDDRLGLAALGVVIGVAVTVWLTRAGRRVRMRWRGARARRMEARAAGMLEAAGYTVVAEQVSGTSALLWDGERIEVEVRADYLVTRGGRTYVAEAKSGRRAPDPANRGTRRQLLEYAIAYEADGVLLVDTERGEVAEVRFPALRPAPRAGLGWAAALGALAGAAAMRWLG